VVVAGERCLKTHTFERVKLATKVKTVVMASATRSYMPNETKRFMIATLRVIESDVIA